MDIQMPVMTGYEATRKIRKAGITIPVVALTANAMSDDRHKCIKAGFNDYLAKPIDREKLYKMLKKFLTAVSNEQKV